MIDIGGADERRPLPGDREHRAAVIRVEEGDRLRERQTPGVEQQMAAPQRPQLRRPADRTAQAVAPYAGSVEDAAGLDLERVAVHRVAQPRAIDAIRSVR